MRKHPTEWNDMSNYIVHFTKGGGDNSDYESMMSIYWTSTLYAKNPFGIGKTKCPNKESQYCVCFSEIPLWELERLVTHRKTVYGIIFEKELILKKGGGPIWYAWKGTTYWKALQMMMEKASDDGNASIWKISPMIDAPGEYLNFEYQFDWEREWRHVGDFSFSPNDVSFLMMPENLHETARSFFVGHDYEHTGPAYLCPYIDPRWDKKKILEALQE